MPRAGLSADAVTDLAVALVDDAGLDALTLAAVAGRAGVAVPSLYKHVGSLAELRSRVALVAVREIVRRTASQTVGRAGIDALRALAHAIRAYAHEHPGLYAATQRADASTGDLALAQTDAVEVFAGVLRGFGLPAERSVDAVRAARAALHGFVQLEQSGGFGMPDDVDASYDALVDVLAAGMPVLAARA